ncbi:hypothetical protein CRENBAI_017339, partial [Crenichthys baileyi]
MKTIKRFKIEDLNLKDMCGAVIVWSVGCLLLTIFHHQVLPGTQTKPRSWLMTDHLRTLRDSGSSPSWRSTSLGAPDPLMRILSILQRFLFIQTTEAPGGPLRSLPRSPDSSAISLADLASPQTYSQGRSHGWNSLDVMEPLTKYFFQAPSFLLPAAADHILESAQEPECLFKVLA